MALNLRQRVVERLRFLPDIQLTVRELAQWVFEQFPAECARDLSDAFPDIRGFSSRNLKCMAFFARHVPMVYLGSSLLPNCPGSMW